MKSKESQSFFINIKDVVQKAYEKQEDESGLPVVNTYQNQFFSPKRGTTLKGELRSMNSTIRNQIFSPKQRAPSNLVVSAAQ